MSDHIIDVMLTLNNSLKRERQQKLLLLFGLFAATLLLILFAERQNLEAASRLMIIAALITGLCMLIFVRDILKFWNPESSPIIQLMQQSPKNIVWVYMLKVELTPFGIRFRKENIICLRLLNGDMLQVRIPDEETAAFMEKLEQVLPQASFGYSREKEQLYGIHPELLLRD